MRRLLKFVITNTYKAFKELFKDIVKFIKRVLEPLTFPWATAHMTLLYYEITNFYLNRCKVRVLPFIEPTTRDLAYVTSNIKNTAFYDDIKEKTTYALRDKIKFLVVPYSVAEPYKIKLKAMKDAVEKHNTQFKEIDQAELEIQMSSALNLYGSIFSPIGFDNE